MLVLFSMLYNLSFRVVKSRENARAIYRHNLLKNDNIG